MKDVASSCDLLLNVSFGRRLHVNKTGNGTEKTAEFSEFNSNDPLDAKQRGSL